MTLFFRETISSGSAVITARCSPSHRARSGALMIRLDERLCLSLSLNTTHWQERGPPLVGSGQVKNSNQKSPVCEKYKWERKKRPSGKSHEGTNKRSRPANTSNHSVQHWLPAVDSHRRNVPRPADTLTEWCEAPLSYSNHLLVHIIGPEPCGSIDKQTDKKQQIAGAKWPKLSRISGLCPITTPQEENKQTINTICRNI